MIPFQPHRLGFLLLAATTIVVGLVIHEVELGLPAALRDILGDALWAMMMAWFVGVAVPTIASRLRAGIALLICWAVEFSQRYHSPGIDGLRATTPGQLVLGSGFNARDLLAYTLGVAAAFVLERAMTGRGMSRSER